MSIADLREFRLWLEDRLFLAAIALVAGIALYAAGRRILARVGRARRVQR